MKLEVKNDYVQNFDDAEKYWWNRKEISNHDIKHYPDLLIVEGSTKCNLKCPMCMEHGYKGSQTIKLPRPESLPAELYEKIKKACQMATSIEPSGYGEPFYSEDVWNFVRFLEKNIADDNGNVHRKICLISNGSLKFTKERIDNALGKTIKKITFSVHAATNKNRKFLQGGSIVSLWKNIADLCNERSQRGLEKDIQIISTFAVMKSNYSELMEFVRGSFEAGVDAVDISALRVYEDKVLEDWNVKVGDRAFSYADEMVDFNGREWPLLLEELKKIEKQYGKPIYASHLLSGQEENVTVSDCWFPFRAISISTDGNVYPCCVNQTQPIGNLNETDFDSIWFGSDYKNMRNMLQKNDIPKWCDGMPCSYQTNNKNKIE